jgi:hypothetical protein
MEDVKYIAKKDFIPFLKDDEITFCSDGYSQIYISVKRAIDVRFNGNENGRFGINNPYNPKKMKPFIWIKEFRNFRLCEIKKPDCPVDKDFYGEHGTSRNLYSTQEWMDICIKKMIENFTEIGIL